MEEVHEAGPVSGRSQSHSLSGFIRVLKELRTGQTRIQHRMEYRME